MIGNKKTLRLKKTRVVVFNNNDLRLYEPYIPIDFLELQKQKLLIFQLQQQSLLQQQLQSLEHCLFTNFAQKTQSINISETQRYLKQSIPPKMIQKVNAPLRRVMLPKSTNIPIQNHKTKFSKNH
jgi:hypothetical protein